MLTDDSFFNNCKV